MLAASFLIAEKYIETMNNFADPKKNIVLKANLLKPDEIMENSINMLEKTSKLMEEQRKIREKFE